MQQVDMSIETVTYGRCAQVTTTHISVSMNDVCHTLDRFASVFRLDFCLQTTNNQSHCSGKKREGALANSIHLTYLSHIYVFHPHQGKSYIS